MFLAQTPKSKILYTLSTPHNNNLSNIDLITAALKKNIFFKVLNKIFLIECDMFCNELICGGLIGARLK